MIFPKQFSLRVTPNASRTEFKEEDGKYKLYLQAVPEKGKANAAVIKFFKKAYIREVDNIEKAINFVYEYKWSNLKKAFSASKKSMHCDLLKNEFITKDAYNGFLSDWIKYGKPGSAIQ